MQRMLCAAAAALALLCLSLDAAEARAHVYYRVKCAGTYCWPVAEPAPRHHGAHRKARRARARSHIARRVPAGASHGAPIAVDNDGRIPLAATSARRDGAASTAPVEVARRYLGGNPIGWAHVWCGAFMRLVMRSAGYPDLPSGDLAAAWAHYGRPSVPQPGAIVVWPHHVGLITAVHGNGLATVISGNDGHRVRERVMSIARAIVRMPG
jgi:CHAP domain-containing protein